MGAAEVKDEIDAQSGRFDFFKQGLTLGLAGLAGIAAFFTDTAKIPSDSGSLGAVCVIGVALLVVVGAALMGLSVYANLLKANSAGEPVDGFRKSMIGHARWVFVAILVTALAFIVYAGLQIAHRAAPRIAAGEAIAIARKALAAGGCEAAFETLERRDRQWVTAFRSEACRREYRVQIESDSGEVSRISLRVLPAASTPAPECPQPSLPCAPPTPPPRGCRR